MSECPISACSPWDFYESLLKLAPDSFLILYNEKKEVRMMKTFGVALSRDSVDFLLLVLRLLVGRPSRAWHLPDRR